MNYIAKKNVGRHGVGTIVTESDFVDGRIAELIGMGVIEPADGVAVDWGNLPSITAAYKALEEENRELRTAKGGPAQQAKIRELTAEVKELKGALKKALDDLAGTMLGMVKKAEYDALQNRYDQLNRLHDSTVKEFEKFKVTA